MEDELERVVRHATGRAPLAVPPARHLTINPSAGCSTSFEKVNREIPFNGLHWFFDHAETITERNIERVKALAAA